MNAHARIALLLVVTLLPATTAHAQEASAGSEPFHEVIDMSPEDKAGWSMRNVFAPIASLFRGGPSYYYSQRELKVDTTPTGGVVDLFYVRANFQKRFEQAETPVTILLPPRIEASTRDSLTIRAFREGYRQRSTTVKISEKVEQLVIDLEPLPNSLAATSHRYFAGRASLSFLTAELPEFRIQELEDGFTLVLNETALSKEAAAALEGIASPLVEAVYPQQLGEDLLITVTLQPGARGSTDVRSRQGRDAARDLYEFTLDLVPSDGAESVQRALDALGRIGTRHVSGCALRFDGELHERLDPGELSRALVPRGAFTDRYLRAAMRRLGEVTPGAVVDFAGGARFDPTVPIELEAALSQAGAASGYLALLRQFVSEMEPEKYRRETLRSLIAPERDASAFESDLQRAERAERDCLAAL